MTRKTKAEATETLVFLVLGSNIEPRQDFLAAATTAIAAWPECVRVHYLSPLHETEPYGVVDQAPFLNQLMVIVTPLLPLELLARAKQVEQQVGRQETFPWGPREIDIDIVFYGSWAVDVPELRIPHVDYRNRQFVLDLLHEYDPNFCDPYTGEPVGR
ncbi:2-amino-4-hydroxy-6-hydroxymethyldihydropteridine diphosphokinase [Chrysiogenes arsenatis]|uniref:2-amino-4-hydroxy-6- hydroxymethyldihydropteridine diphosphokinase n=1 Tax=Chrysiogenes arsenatis TaxID=309797 RepID=UPI0006873915|nr:2-amino-4-hydroxy-6-hydroxymethyldihydropteridine diphosphokinase [Chrysiogenes arsenatis]